MLENVQITEPLEYLLVTEQDLFWGVDENIRTSCSGRQFAVTNDGLIGVVAEWNSTWRCCMCFLWRVGPLRIAHGWRRAHK